MIIALFIGALRYKSNSKYTLYYTTHSFQTPTALFKNVSSSISHKKLFTEKEIPGLKKNSS